MKFPATLTLLSLAACVSFAAEAGDPKAGAGGMEDLVTRLASDSFREREDATLALWERGEAALESLRAASVSDDPERAKRAAGVLEKVELRITPETPPEIFEQIRRFRTAPQNLKANHIHELRRLKAYYQLLKLYSMEKRPEIRSEMAALIRGIAMLGAREALAEDDFATAESLLRMSPKEPNDLIALAWLYRGMGRLGEGMEDPPAPDGVETEDWKITLLRVKGDLDGAARLAEESRRSRSLAGLKVLQGDPTLWIRQNGNGERGAQALDAYVAIALKRWEGKKVNEADFAPLLRILDDRDSDDQAHAVASLAALGRMAEAETHKAKENPELGFAHYLSQERIGEALQTVGLDPEKPDYSAWVAGRFKKMVDEEEDGGDGSPLTELRMIAGFLETRGLSKELGEAYSAPLANYAKERPEGFIDFMASLFEPSSGAPRFAAASGAIWAGDDENRWGELFSAAFGEEPEVSEWLAWVAEIEPGISRPDTLRVMMALFGLGSDPDDLYRKWLDKAWKAAKNSPEEDKVGHIERIRTLAVARQDVATALKARDALGGESMESAMWPSVDKYFSAASRWKDAAGILEKNGDRVKNSPDFHAYLAVTLRRAGFDNRAAHHDALAEKLSLGYSPVCSRIGNLYVYGGDMERAAVWYRRAALHADVSGGDFVAVLDTYARSMFEDGRWEIAASCHEALVHAYASEQFSGGSSLSVYSKARLSADLSKALALLPADRERAVALLEGIHRNFSTDGILADDFFPALRKVGLRIELEKWFGESWAELSAVIGRFPECDNTRNTAAWLASRARMKLPEAEKHLLAAIAKNPGQAAYLDTMAEVRFAMGDRAGAVKWSELSLLHYPLIDPPYDTMIRKQHHRFRNDPLPQ